MRTRSGRPLGASAKGPGHSSRPWSTDGVSPPPCAAPCPEPPCKNATAHKIDYSPTSGEYLAAKAVSTSTPSIEDPVPDATLETEHRRAAATPEAVEETREPATRRIPLHVRTETYPVDEQGAGDAAAPVATAVDSPGPVALETRPARRVGPGESLAAVSPGSSRAGAQSPPPVLAPTLWVPADFVAVPDPRPATREQPLGSGGGSDSPSQERAPVPPRGRCPHPRIVLSMPVSDTTAPVGATCAAGSPVAAHPVLVPAKAGGESPSASRPDSSQGGPSCAESISAGLGC